MILFLVILAVSGALMLGTCWGVYGKLSSKMEGFLVALAGGALMYSVVTELIEPGFKESSIWWAMSSVVGGAVIFTLVDYWIEKVMEMSDGAGLVAAVTLDGIPENLALGVALIGAGFGEVAALAGSIFLSNLPEAAGGAKEMADDGMPRKKILLVWGGTTALLIVAALSGNLLLRDVSEPILANVRCFAAGAVVASLATEVFPKAYKKEHYWAGIATTAGFGLAICLEKLG